MKKIIVFVALLVASFSSMASPILKRIVNEPWRLVLESNEKVYTIQCVFQTDSGFTAITESDTLFYTQNPNLQTNQVIIINTDDMRCDNLYRNEDMVWLLMLFGGIFFLLLILTVIAVIIMYKK